MMHRLRIDWTIFWYYYFCDQNEYHVMMTSQIIVLALNRVLAFTRIFSKMCQLCLRWVPTFCCAEFHKNLPEKLWDILYIGYILCVNWRLEFIEQLSHFLDVSGKFMPLILIPCAFSKPLKAGRLKRFGKTRKYMNPAKHNIELLFSFPGFFHINSD